MARDGSGTFSLLGTLAPSGEVSNPTTINAIMDDIATSLTNSVNKDGTKAFAAAQSMGGFKLTNLATATARTDAAALGNVQDGTANWIDGGGTADAITATYSPALTTLVDGQLCFVRATAANATTTPTFAPNGLTARTIVKEGGSALVAGDIAGDGHELILRYDLSNTRWELLNPVAASLTAASTTEALTGTDTDKFVTANALAALWEQGSDIASAGTISVGEGGYFHVTGTTTITDIDFATDKTGRAVKLVFDGALTLTHNATTLILPGGANITTAAGDTAVFVSEGSDNVRCVSYELASGGVLPGDITAPMLNGAQTGSAPIFAARAWVNFNGTGTVAIKGSGNVTSITDNGIGDYTVTFTTAMADANYGVSISNVGLATGNMTRAGVIDGDADTGPDDKTTTTLSILFGSTVNGAVDDLSDISVVIYR